ncbi:MAG: biotin transporter BioY [Candidatus Sericytochromatia bacterium]|nr:biotin transporter BioY [Candidatus Sericytochromatia bacterium]
MLRLLQLLLFTTLLACSAFVAVKIPFLTWGPPRHLSSADGLYELRGLVFGSHVITAQLPLLWLTAAWLGPRRGAVAAMLYLGIGLGGLPVFSLGGGLDYVTQATFGYLLAFLPAVVVAGQLAVQPRFGAIWSGFFKALLIVQAVGFVFQFLREGVLGTPSLWLPFFYDQVIQFLPGQVALLTALAAAVLALRKFTYVALGLLDGGAGEPSAALPSSAQA